MTLFNKHKLDVVIVQSLGTFSTYDELCEGLYRAFRDVAKGRIVEEEEGSVVYLTLRDKTGNRSLDRVLSMAKLKTIEYRIFRKMREKLRGYYNNEMKTGKAGDTSAIVKKFNKEMKDILEGNETPKPIEYYTGILEGAFRFIQNNPTQKDTLNNEYITFQQNLLKFLASEDKYEEYDKEMFNSRALDEEVKEIKKKDTAVSLI